MWSIPLIIGIAVVGAVLLLMVGVAIAIVIERRRHKRILREHGVFERRLSHYHRPMLSVNDDNYPQISPPKSKLRRSIQMPYGIITEAGRYSLSSDDQIDLEAEHSRRSLSRNSLLSNLTTTKSDPRRSLRRHTFRMPSFRKHQNHNKTHLLNHNPRSPLSAITEFTDSSHGNSPTPAGRDRASETEWQSESEKLIDLQQPPLVVRRSRMRDQMNTDSIHLEDMVKTIIRVNSSTDVGDPGPEILDRTSSETFASFQNAPQEPLPPVPAHHPGHRMVSNSPNHRASTASMDTVRSSILGSVRQSHPRSSYPASTSKVDPGLHNFDFDLKSDSPASLLRKRQKSQLRNLIHKASSDKVSAPFRLSDGVMNPAHRLSTMSEQSSDCVKSQDSLQTVDAGGWSVPRGGRNYLQPISVLSNRTRSTMIDTSARHSMIEPRNQMVMDLDRFPSSIAGENLKTSRPASVASSQPVRWDKHSSTPDRLEHGMTYRPGHKRQNCIRITNLPDPQQPQRPSKLPQMQDIKEESELHSGDMKGGVEPLELEPAQAARSSFAFPDSKFKSTKVDLYRSFADVSQNDLDIFGPLPQRTISPDIFTAISSHRWIVTPDGTSRLISQPNTPSSLIIDGTPYTSPVLPSPALKPAALFLRKNHIIGPRKFPASGNSSRSASPSPLNRKRCADSVKKRQHDDLRRSVMILRSANSELQLLDKARESMFCNFGLDDQLDSPSSADTGEVSESKPLLSKSRRLSSLLKVSTEPCSRNHLTGSPSAMSIAATSIWEDESIRGDSPDPEAPPVPEIPVSLTKLPLSPLPHGHFQGQASSGSVIQLKSVGQLPVISTKNTPQSIHCAVTQSTKTNSTSSSLHVGHNSHSVLVQNGHHEYLEDIENIDPAMQIPFSVFELNHKSNMPANFRFSIQPFPSTTITTAKQNLSTISTPQTSLQSSNIAKTIEIAGPYRPNPGLGLIIPAHQSQRPSTPGSSPIKPSPNKIITSKEKLLAAIQGSSQQKETTVDIPSPKQYKVMTTPNPGKSTMMSGRKSQPYTPSQTIVPATPASLYDRDGFLKE